MMGLNLFWLGSKLGGGQSCGEFLKIAPPPALPTSSLSLHQPSRVTRRPGCSVVWRPSPRWCVMLNNFDGEIYLHGITINNNKPPVLFCPRFKVAADASALAHVSSKVLLRGFSGMLSVSTITFAHERRTAHVCWFLIHRCL